MYNWTPGVSTFLSLSVGFLFGCANTGTDSIRETGISSCFVTGTQVLTESGRRPIESLQAGDRVWSWDTDTNAPVLRKVIKLIKGESTETFLIQAGEQRIYGVTAEHPFWDPKTQAWIHASDLSLDATLLCWLGVHEAKHVQMNSAPERTPHESPVPVFTLSVEGPEHNFFVNGLLVHNKSEVLQCFDISVAEGPIIDFGEQPTAQTHSKDVILSIQQIEHCDWLEPEERLLTLTFDDPEQVFSGPTEPFVVELETIERPLTLYFSPAAIKDYEGQLELGGPNLQLVKTLRLQLFGKGQESSR